MFPLNNEKKKVFIIAEAGVNHGGNLVLAKKLIDVAKEARADAVKFQTWKPGEITGRFTNKVAYQIQEESKNESRYELSNRLCLSYDKFQELDDYARTKNILFLSTPDGFESLDFLVDKLKIPIIKIGSSEVTHLQFLEAVGKKGLPVILSTGLSNLEEVRAAIKAVKKGEEAPLCLLHCTSAYPTPSNEVNLKAIATMFSEFGLPVGYSDHTIDSHAAVGAVALGACVIEKHFTLDRNMAGPDHKASLDPKDLRKFVASIRTIEDMLGDGKKTPTTSELKNMPGVRRSIVAKKPLKAGTILTPDMLTCKRPGTGLLPEMTSKVLGKKLIVSLEEDEPLEWGHLLP